MLDLMCVCGIQRFELQRLRFAASGGLFDLLPWKQKSEYYGIFQINKDLIIQPLTSSCELFDLDCRKNCRKF